MTEGPNSFKPRSLWGEEDWKKASQLIAEGREEDLETWSDRLEKEMDSYTREGEAALFRLSQYLDTLIDKNPKLEQLKKLRILIREPIVDLASYRENKKTFINKIFEKLGVNSLAEFMVGIESAIIRTVVKEILTTLASINIGAGITLREMIERLESGDSLYNMKDERKKEPPDQKN